jgi:hypothetical protein
VAEAAILNLTYNYTTHLWDYTPAAANGKVNFNPTDIGTVRRFCSGTVTPNGTVIVSEEDLTSGNVNSGVDSYEDAGWLIEIDPATRTVINQFGDNPNADKLWALGRANRENAAIRSDNAVLYTGADHSTNGYIYKFVPTVPGNFSSGSLYVLRTTSSLGNGTWKLLPNSTPAQRNALVTNAAASPAAYNFNGVEDVEIGPDGKIYFTAKGEGKVYRFTDNHTVGNANDVTGLEVFAGNSTPGVSYDVDGPGGAPAESWGTGNDNLAFDGEGNLWVLQDGGRNHIWVIGPGHTQASPQVRLFATTPAGSEPTGITFTPDYNFMFISFQHPSSSNTSSQLDASNSAVVFNTHTTVVIGRKSVLGPLATLPVTFTGFEAKLANDVRVDLNWSVTHINNHDYFILERSVNGIDFIEIYRNSDDINGLPQMSFSYSDNQLPVGASTLYYRIKQCDYDQKCRYSAVKTIFINPQPKITRIYPQPVINQLNIQYHSLAEGAVAIVLRDLNGKTVVKENRTVSRGTQNFSINTANLPKGMYMLVVTDNDFRVSSEKFIKE